MSCGKRFPIQEGRYPNPTPATTIDWHEAEAIYADYVYLFGGRQSLERLAERGGFAPGEGEFIRREAAATRTVAKRLKHLCESP